MAALWGWGVQQDKWCECGLEKYWNFKPPVSNLYDITPKSHGQWPHRAEDSSQMGVDRPFLQVRFCVIVFLKCGVLKGLLGLSWKPPAFLLLPRLTLACQPAFFAFLFKKHLFTKCAFALKRSWNVILPSLFWGNGRGGGWGNRSERKGVTMLSILTKTLDVKLQILIMNKIYIQS